MQWRRRYFDLLIYVLQDRIAGKRCAYYQGISAERETGEGPPRQFEKIKDPDAGL